LFWLSVWRPARRAAQSPADARFGLKIAGAPDIGGKQRLLRSAHGVRGPRGMMNPPPRRTQPPIGASRTPKGATGERQVKLLGLVGMVGIFGFGAEQENAASELIAHEGAALADPFVIAISFEEALAEIGFAISLPPIEFVGLRLDRLDQRARARRGQARKATKRGDDGEGSLCPPAAR